MRIDPAGHRKVDTLIAVKEFFQQQFADSTDQLKMPEEDVQRQLVAMMKVTEPVVSNPVTTPSVVERTGQIQQQDSCPDAESRLDVKLSANIERSADKPELLAEVCLRCFISSAIEQVCVQLEGQFGIKHGFTRHDLFPYVLDAGTPLRRSRRPSRVSYQSVTDSILKTYEPDRSSLTTWTVRLVRRNRELNRYLLECGVYLISDWAILNDTTIRQLRRILSDFHTLTETEIWDASQLLNAYHAVYRHDRLMQRQAGPLGRCSQPSIAQLQRIASHLQTLENLQILESEEKQQAKLERRPERQSDEVAKGPRSEPPLLLARLQQLAERLRQYRIHVRGGPSLVAESLEKNGAYRADALLATTDQALEDREEYGEFIDDFRDQFSSCMDLAISNTIERWVTTMQRKKSPKHQQFLQALSLFHNRGMSMGDIAPLVGLKAQYQVSRLLKLKELRADIRQSLLLELRDRVKLKAERYQSGLKDLQEVDRKIEAALSEQVDDVLHEAAAEASVAQKTVPNRSLYTRRLCQYLQTRSQES